MHLVTFLLSPYWNVVFPSIYLSCNTHQKLIPYTFIEEEKYDIFYDMLLSFKQHWTWYE